MVRARDSSPRRHPVFAPGFGSGGGEVRSIFSAQQLIEFCLVPFAFAYEVVYLANSHLVWVMD
jgi:hypothetical protein